MPVKWTPEKDQLLLLKILETHDLSVDTKKISAAWPTEQGEIPTARAITERLVKIRQNVKAGGAGHFPISSAQFKTSKQKAPAAKPSTFANPALKRKHDGGISSKGNNLNGNPGMRTPAPTVSPSGFVAPVISGAAVINLEDLDEQDITSRSAGPTVNSQMARLSVERTPTVGPGAEDSPSKRPRRQVTVKSEYIESDPETVPESEISEYGDADDEEAV